MFRDYLEAINSRVYICYVGKFNPFHKGHLASWNRIKDLSVNFFILPTSIKEESLLTENQRNNLIEISGIPKDKIKNYSGSGFNIPSLLKTLGASENDILITIFSEKDWKEKQILIQKTKKGEPSAWKLLYQGENINKEILHNIKPVNEVHKEEGIDKLGAYIIVVPDEKGLSSSKIRELIKQNKWQSIKPIMVNDKAFKYLQEVIINE